MDPYFVLGISPDVTDKEVEERYKELVGEFPPDSFPDRFSEVRRAYEALSTARRRVKTHLFRFDDTGRAIMDSCEIIPLVHRRRRLSSQELASVLKGE